MARTFWGQRSYDCAGKPVKATRNWMAELGYRYVRDVKGIRRLIRLEEMKKR